MATTTLQPGNAPAHPDAFAQALAAAQAANIPMKAKGLSDDDVDQLSDIELTAIKAVLAIPAPDFAGVAAKLRVFLAGYTTGHDDIRRGILADAERLTAKGPGRASRAARDLSDAMAHRAFEEIHTMLRVLDQSELLYAPDDQENITLGSNMFTFIAVRANALRKEIDALIDQSIGKA